MPTLGVELTLPAFLTNCWSESLCEVENYANSRIVNTLKWQYNNAAVEATKAYGWTTGGVDHGLQVVYIYRCNPQPCVLDEDSTGRYWPDEWEISASRSPAGAGKVGQMVQFENCC